MPAAHRPGDSSIRSPGCQCEGRHVVAGAFDTLARLVLASFETLLVAMKAEPGRPAGQPAAATLRAVRIPFIHKAALTAGDRTEELFLVDLGVSGAFAE